MRVSRRKVLNINGIDSSISGRRAEQSPSPVIKRRMKEMRSCAARNDAFSMATRDIPRFCVVCGGYNIMCIQISLSTIRPKLSDIIIITRAHKEKRACNSDYYWTSLD